MSLERFKRPQESVVEPVVVTPQVPQKSDQTYTINNLMWAEKWRPKSLNELVGQEAVVSRLRGFVQTKNMPHLLFHGRPGTGKTTAAHALKNDLFGKASDAAFLEMNASDERRLEDIRTTVKSFAENLSLMNVPFKLLCLDEADNMTSASQQALRRIMETASHNVRFILIANEVGKIILPIQSRCSKFSFKQLSSDQIRVFLMRIVQGENILVDESGLAFIIEVCRGDLRQAANILQSCAEMGKTITKETILSVVCEPSIDSVRAVLQKALEGRFLDAMTLLQQQIYDQGLSGQSVLERIYEDLKNMPVSEKTKIEITKCLGQTMTTIFLAPQNDNIQLASFLANLSSLKNNGVMSQVQTQVQPNESGVESKSVQSQTDSKNWFGQRRKE